MSAIRSNPQSRIFTASELRRLPPEQRDAILTTAAAQAEREYVNNPELTAFDAFGEGELHGDSASSESKPR